MKTLIALGMAAAVALGAASAGAQDKTPAKNNCFRSQDWDGWSAPGDGDFLYLRVRKDIFRVDLAPGSHVQKTGDRFLVSRVHGSDYICSALDLQLTLSDHNGLSEPVLANSLRKLTPEEAAAVPPKDRP